MLTASRSRVLTISAATAAPRRRTPCRPAAGRRRPPACSRASSTVEMPPTPTSVRSGPTRLAQQRAAPRAARARAAGRRARRRRPPRPRSGWLRRPSRQIVVLVATMPSSPISSARSATASTSSSARSGAILTSSGTRRVVPPSATRRTCSQERAQALDGLQAAQARRVRRADVDDEVVGVGREQPRRRRVVGQHGGLVVIGHDLGLADVDARRGPAAGPARPAARRRAGRRPPRRRRC